MEKSYPPPVGKLHPAIARPGRCASEIEFDTLSAAAARAWIKKRKEPLLPQVTGSMSVAQLYGLLEDFEGTKTPAGVLGFKRNGG
jgi:hypothetical protein